MHIQSSAWSLPSQRPLAVPLAASREPPDCVARPTILHRESSWSAPRPILSECCGKHTCKWSPRRGPKARSDGVGGTLRGRLRASRKALRFRFSGQKYRGQKTIKPATAATTVAKRLIGLNHGHGSPHNGLGLVVRSDIGSNLPVVVIIDRATLRDGNGHRIAGRNVSSMAWSSFSSRLRFEFSGSLLSGDCCTGVSNAGGWERPRIGAFPGTTSR